MKSVVTLALLLSAATSAFADHTQFTNRPAASAATAAQTTAPARARTARPYVRGQLNAAPRTAGNATVQAAPAERSAQPYMRGQTRAQSAQS